jgi:hypothetical protein
MFRVYSGDPIEWEGFESESLKLLRYTGDGDSEILGWFPE